MPITGWLRWRHFSDSNFDKYRNLTEGVVLRMFFAKAAKLSGRYNIAAAVMTAICSVILVGAGSVPAWADTVATGPGFEVRADAAVQNREVVEEKQVKIEKVTLADGLSIDLYRLANGDIIWFSTYSPSEDKPIRVRLRVASGAAVNPADFRYVAYKGMQALGDAYLTQLPQYVQSTTTPSYYLEPVDGVSTASNEESGVIGAGQSGSDSGLAVGGVKIASGSAVQGTVVSGAAITGSAVAGSATQSGIMASSGELPDSSVFVGDKLFFSRTELLQPYDNSTFKAMTHMTSPISYGDVPVQATATGAALTATPQAIAADTTEYVCMLPGLKGHVTTQWGIISANQPFIDFNTLPAEAIAKSDFLNYRKFTKDGWLEQTNSDYIPSGQDIYWNCPAQFLASYYVQPELRSQRFFEDILKVMAYQTVARQNSYGYWTSTTGSGWLSNDYGITPGYYDTRFSTDAAAFLLTAYDYYQDPKFLASATKYGDYLVQHVTERGTRTANGMLSPDYWNDTLPPTATPHTSLNHQLAEMNFLNRLYLATTEPKYFDTGKQLLGGLRDTGLGWIKPDGDLWYAIDVKGKFIRQDYPTLTLNDLATAQQLLVKVTGTQDNILGKLHDSKQVYAVKQGWVKAK